MAYEIRINPIDLEPDVAVGVDLPMSRPNGADFQLNYTTIDQAVANAKNLLLTEKGERIMIPTFGCDIKKTLFENITEETIETLRQNIETNFATFLPYIFINELTITDDVDNNKMFIKMVISLQGNQFDTRPILVEINTTQ
jgi:phage baseplate assembly protein W